MDVFFSEVITARFPNHSPIFTSELYTIFLALRLLQYSRSTQFMVFGPPYLSSLFAIHDNGIKNLFIIDINRENRICLDSKSHKDTRH